MTNLSTRQQQILALVDEKGFVTIEALADSFGVSAQTIRREIIALDKISMLQRFHGGAGRAADTDKLRLGHEYKALHDNDEKDLIARHAMTHISNGDTLYIDVGTTMETVATHLNGLEQLTVLTNSMLVAIKLDHTRHSVHVLGGEVAGQDGSLVGEQVVLQLRDLRLDHALIGCSAIEPDGSVMDFDKRKIAIKQAARSVSRHSYLLASNRKFERTAFARICHRDDFDEVISGSSVLALTGCNGLLTSLLALTWCCDPSMLGCPKVSTISPKRRSAPRFLLSDVMEQKIAQRLMAVAFRFKSCRYMTAGAARGFKAGLFFFIL